MSIIKITLVALKMNLYLLRIALKQFSAPFNCPLILRQTPFSSNKKYNDFIDLLINAEKDSKNSNVVDRDVNDANEAHHVNEGHEELDSERKALSGVSEKYLTEDEMLAQVWVFFNAGYETTATTLTFASYELALNPDIQERLYDEVMTEVDRVKKILTTMN